MAPVRQPSLRLYRSAFMGMLLLGSRHLASRKAFEAELKKQSVLALSDRVLLLVEELQERQYKKLIGAVEQDLNQKFRELIRKDDFVNYIYLDHDFSLHLVRSQAVEVSALKRTAKKYGVSALKDSLKDIGYSAFPMEKSKFWLCRCIGPL